MSGSARRAHPFGRSIVVGVTVVMLGAVVFPVRSSAVAGCWRRVTMPEMDGSISGADFLSTTSGWAVGSRLTPDGDIGAISLRWNGSTWSAVEVPWLSGSDHLDDVVAVSQGEVWAVGASGGVALILRWNGSSWRRVAAPTPGRRSSLMAVARDPRSGVVLAVGEWTHRDRSYPLILRWTGVRWRTALRRAGVSNARLADVSVGRDATWAVGDYGRHGNHTPLILRRTSNGWVRSPVPAAPGSRWISAVAAAGLRDALVVGQRWEHAIVLHWNGASWRSVPTSRIPGLDRSESLHDVSMLPSGDAWIAASRSRLIGSTDPDYRYHPQAIFHRRGGSWAWERPPKVPYALVSDVSPVTSSDIWALGAVALEDGGSPLAFRC